MKAAGFALGLLLIATVSWADERLAACDQERAAATLLAQRFGTGRTQAEVELARAEVRIRQLMQEIERLKAEAAKEKK